MMYYSVHFDYCSNCKRNTPHMDECTICDSHVQKTDTPLEYQDELKFFRSIDSAQFCGHCQIRTQPKEKVGLLGRLKADSCSQCNTVYNFTEKMNVPSVGDVTFAYLNERLRNIEILSYGKSKTDRLKKEENTGQIIHITEDYASFTACTLINYLQGLLNHVDEQYRALTFRLTELGNLLKEGNNGSDPETLLSWAEQYGTRSEANTARLQLAYYHKFKDEYDTLYAEFEDFKRRKVRLNEEIMVYLNCLANKDWKGAISVIEKLPPVYASVTVECLYLLGREQDAQAVLDKISASNPPKPPPPRYPCPNCGSIMSFSQELGKYRCDKCGDR